MGLGLGLGSHELRSRQRVMMGSMAFAEAWKAAAFGVVSTGAASIRVTTWASGVDGAGISEGGHSEGLGEVGEGGREPETEGVA